MATKTVTITLRAGVKDWSDSEGQIQLDADKESMNVADRNLSFTQKEDICDGILSQEITTKGFDAKAFTKEKKKVSSDPYVTWPDEIVVKLSDKRAFWSDPNEKILLSKFQAKQSATVKKKDIVFPHVLRGISTGALVQVAKESDGIIDENDVDTVLPYVQAGLLQKITNILDNDKESHIHKLIDEAKQDNVHEILVMLHVERTSARPRQEIMDSCKRKLEGYPDLPRDELIKRSLNPIASQVEFIGGTGKKSKAKV